MSNKKELSWMDKMEKEYIKKLKEEEKEVVDPFINMGTTNKQRSNSILDVTDNTKSNLTATDELMIKMYVDIIELRLKLFDLEENFSNLIKITDEKR